MIVEIAKNIIPNVSVLVLIAYLLTKVRLVRQFIVDEGDKLYPKLIMSLIFGLIGILSTYTGVRVQGAIANTRAVAVVVGGIVGGPLVGILSGIIAGMHRYLIDIGGFTAVACAISTILEGLIGGLFAKRLKRGNKDWDKIFFIAVFAEIVQMLVILLVAKPFADALRLVEVISLPMIFLNSMGVVVFIGIFDSVFVEEDREAAHRIRLAMRIADQCLPHLRHGLHDIDHLTAAVQIIREQASVVGVVMTDRRQMLCSAFEEGFALADASALPTAARMAIETGGVYKTEDNEETNPLSSYRSKCSIVGAPLKRGDEVIGALVMFSKKFKFTRETDYGFVEGLAQIFSTQLELSDVEYQKKLLQRAEYAALQSQINPHFLFNALLTITSFCREKPERARELLLALSSYFRNTLQTGDYMIPLEDEIKHVSAYLELEKARFEEKLQVEIALEQSEDCIVPSLSLQPLVENAVKHGAMKRTDGQGRVRIRSVQTADDYLITVEDNGAGIPEEVLAQLRAHTLSGHSVGLANVDKRLRSIYGEDYGLQVETSEQGSCVRVRIPKTHIPEERGDSSENSGY